MFRTRKKEIIQKELSKLEKRNEEIIEEIKEIDVENDDVDTLTQKLDDLEKEKKEIEETIGTLKAKLNELDQDEKIEEKGEERTMNLRTKVNNLLTRDENVQFYEDVKKSLQNRAITNGKITVPTEIVDLISELVKEQSVMLKYVRILNLSGNGTILLPATIEDAVWVEYGGGLTEKNLGLSKIEINAHKLGAFIIVPNDFEKDSAVNLAEYITKALATSIAKALDKAIVSGDGANKPTGIINGTHADNKLTLEAKKQTLTDILAPVSKVDKKNDNAPFKVFVKASTNFNKILPLAIQANADGRIVAFVDKFPATSWEVVECDAIPENTLLIGLANQYLLSQREGIVIDQSPHFKFTDDATVFRGLARYDGKLQNDKAFVVLTLA